MKHQHPALPSAAAPVPADKAAADDPPTFADLAADPEIAPLLDFEPVVRQMQKAGGWSAEMQRMFIAWLAHYGSPGKAAIELGKARSGIDKVFTSPGAESFRLSWEAAMALAERRRIARVVAENAGAGGLKMPTITRRRAEERAAAHDTPPAPGMVRNEEGEWEDEAAYNRRGDEARDSISSKLQRCRRLYLQEISHSPAHRAAFEILTKLPIDWDKAALGKAQDDEPWRAPNMRTPEMILTAENGWMGGIVHGPDKRVELLKRVNAYRVEMGLPEIEWEESGSTERSDAGA